MKNIKEFEVYVPQSKIEKLRMLGLMILVGEIMRL